MKPLRRSSQAVDVTVATAVAEGLRCVASKLRTSAWMTATATTRTPLYGERAIAEAELICFDNPRPERPYEVSITLPEFTCKCPFSGYPDFATLRLIYQPGPRVMELKAIKLYVNSYRDRSISHEEVTNRILDDLVEALDPVWMQLEADFNPRGNVHTVVRVSHGSRQPC